MTTERSGTGLALARTVRAPPLGDERLWQAERRDHHARGAEGARGDRGTDVLVVVVVRRERLDVLRRVRGLLDDRPLAWDGDDQMGLDVRVAPQRLEEPDPVDRAGRARDANDQTHHRRNLFRKTSSRVFW